jgi:hypothetical protein
VQQRQLALPVLVTSSAELGLLHAGAGEGLVLPAGVYQRPLVLTSVRSFSKFGVKIMVRGWQHARRLTSCTIHRSWLGRLAASEQATLTRLPAGSPARHACRAARATSTCSPATSPTTRTGWCSRACPASPS